MAISSVALASHPYAGGPVVHNPLEHQQRPTRGRAVISISHQLSFSKNLGTKSNHSCERFFKEASRSFLEEAQAILCPVDTSLSKLLATSSYYYRGLPRRAKQTNIPARDPNTVCESRGAVAESLEV